MPPSAHPSQLRWLYVDLNSFFASVEQQERPALRGKPVIITPIDSDYTSAIAVSYEAKARGVRMGMSVRDARQVCPEIAVLPARHDVYVAYHHRIIAEVENHIHVSQVCSIDEVACALMGREALPEAAARIGKAIQTGLMARLGPSIRCSVGIAPSRLLAKMASDMQKPLGLTILPMTALPDALARLDISDIPGVGRRMGERLRAAGVDTIPALWHGAPGRARMLWRSIEGERVWYALHGIDPPEIITRRQSVGHSVILPPALRNGAGGREAARHLLVRASARLRRIRYHARAFSLSIRLMPDGWTGDTARFPATNDALTLLHIFDALWERQTDVTPATQLKKVGVTLHHLLDPETPQLSLFEPEPGEQDRKAQAVSAALDAINHRFGQNALTIGTHPEALSRYTGAKIAFTRIPTTTDFTE